MNVWCNPEQDNQTIIRAARISRPGGEFIAMTHMDRRLKMPKDDRRFHLFQVGDISPKTLGLLHTPKYDAWISFTDAVNERDLIANLYTESGANIPLHRSYFIYTRERALIFAIDLSSFSKGILVEASIFMRLYTNAWYSSDEGKALGVRTATNGLQLLNPASLLPIRNEIATYQSMPGAVFCYVNGQLTHTLNALTTTHGDVVEYVYDASVKRIVDWKISDLHTFTSELDQELKYLLHYPDPGEDQIDYVDDIDVYVYYKTQTGYIGRMVPRNLRSSLRMVTHRDYALSVPVTISIADRLISDLELPVLARDLYVRLYIRSSGMIRPLIKEAARVFELYKLDDERVLAALTGVDSTVPFWTAPALEASGYTQLMRTFSKHMDIDLIEEAYGYNAITQILGDTPTKVPASPGARYVRLAPALQASSTIYEYDQDGLLLNWHYHEGSSMCLIQDSATRLIQAIAGKGTRDTKKYYGTNYLPIPASGEYRVYMCNMVDGKPDRNWSDITDSEYYRVENNILIWNDLLTGHYLMVRDNSTFLAYDLDSLSVGGVYYFDLVESIDGEYQVLDVPLGDLDIWVNGRCLVQGIGFHYQHPRVTIVDKTVLAQPAGSVPQRFTVRFTGFSDKSLKPKAVEDSGFVMHGMLSDNSRFNLRDDRVLHITVGGLLKHRDDILFDEETLGVSVVNAINGQPYQVKEIVVPVDGWTKTKTTQFKAESVIRDKIVSDYMTRMLPPPVRNAVSSVTQRYNVYSPFLSRIINDLFEKNIDYAKIDKELSDGEILELCQPYEWLLAYDPINLDIPYNRNLILIHPHHLNRKIVLGHQEYAFIKKVVRLYAKNLVSLSEHLLIQD